MNPEAMMPDIYVAPAYRPHFCAPPDRPPFSVYRCDWCGKYWHCTSEMDGLAPPAYLWKRVRWWNFRARTAIRAASRIPHGGYAPGKSSSELERPQGLRNPPPNGAHNPARPGDCRRLCGAPGCASWGCLR